MAKRNLLKRLPAEWAKRLKRVGEEAGKKKVSVWLVGGPARDLMLGRSLLDADVCVEGPAAGLVERLSALWSVRVVQHPAFLTYTLLLPDGQNLDVATARQEVYVEPAALPVVEPAALREDLMRRDFTINAMALCLLPRQWGKFLDPFNGAGDIEKKTLRILHLKSFEDDPTRIFRAARYAGRFDLRLDPQTEDRLRTAVEENLPARLSAARRRNEIEAILKEEDPRAALDFLAQWGVLRFLHSDLTLPPEALRRMGPARGENLLLLRWLLWLQDRPAQQAFDILRALEFPTALCEEVRNGLISHARLLQGEPPPFAFRLSDSVVEFLALTSSDQRLSERLRQSRPHTSGNDLKRLGYRPGPIFQDILAEIARQRWNGGLETKEEEERFVVDKFPLHEYH